MCKDMEKNNLTTILLPTFFMLSDKIYSFPDKI